MKPSKTTTKARPLQSFLFLAPFYHPIGIYKVRNKLFTVLTDDDNFIVCLL